MNQDEKVAIFTSLARIEEKLDSMQGSCNETKDNCKVNTKFRYYATAFIILVMGGVSFMINVDKVKDTVSNTHVTRVIK